MCEHVHILSVHFFIRLYCHMTTDSFVPQASFEQRCVSPVWTSVSWVGVCQRRYTDGPIKASGQREVVEYSSSVLTGVKHPWANFEWDTKYKVAGTAMPRKLRVTYNNPQRLKAVQILDLLRSLCSQDRVELPYKQESERNLATKICHLHYLVFNICVG